MRDIMMNSTGAVRVAFLVLCGLVGSARADAQNALPAFDVVSPQGAVVHSAGLSNQSRWLIVYVAPACAPCDRLLAMLAASPATLATARLVVVIGANVTAAGRYAAEHLSGLPVSWYADVSGEGRRSLGLQQPVALVAVENGQRQWTVSGVLNDPRALETVIRTWVE